MSYDDFVAALDKSVENNEIQVGDLVLWGLERDFLAKCLFGIPVTDYQLPAMISYMSLQTGMRWSDAISHIGMVVGFDETKKGAKSIITLESGGDFTTGWNGLMKHHLLNYLDPTNVRSLRIVRFWPDITDKKDQDEFQQILGKIISEPPFQTGSRDFGRLHRDRPEDFPLAMPIGHEYNIFQLLQFATAALAANPKDPGFGKVRKAILNMGNHAIPIPQEGSYFCSQAVSEILHRIALEYASKGVRGRRIKHQQTFFTDGIERIEGYTSLYADPILQAAQDAKLALERKKSECHIYDLPWNGVVSENDFENIAPEPVPEVEATRGTFFSKPLNYILDAFASNVTKIIQKELIQGLGVDPAVVQSLSGRKDGPSTRERMAQMGINYDQLKHVTRTSKMNYPKMPSDDEMKRLRTNVFGYVAPSDFLSKIVPLVEKDSEGNEYHYQGPDMNDPHVKTVFLF